MENPETTTPPSNRSVGLGVVLECLARLAASGPDRYAGHRGALASARVAYWRWNSRPRRVGRPALAADLRALIRQMRAANPLWGAPGIHDELQKLGIDVSQATTVKYLGCRAGSPVPLVAHLPHQSRRRARLDRLLHGPTATFRVVRVRGAVSQPTPHRPGERHGPEPPALPS
jgi:hypothetical protein